MREANEDEAAIRRLLLGDIGEEERQRIEERFIADADYRDGVLMAENELIEDYLEGSLTERENEQFRAHFLTTPQQQRKVRIARAIRKHAAVEVESAAHSPPAPPAEHTARVTRRPKPSGALGFRSPSIYIPLAAALVIAFVLGAWWLVQKRRANDLRAREEAQRLERERELAGLNGPGGLPQPGVPVASFALAPVSVRGAGGPPPLPRADEAGLIELRLLRGGEDYASYRVTIRKVGTADLFTVGDLRLADTPSGKAVPLKIPARLLTRGLYSLTLSGVTAAGEVEEAGEYTFRVND